MATDGKTNRWNGVAYNASDERLLDAILHMPGPAAAAFSGRGGRRVNGAGLVVSVAGSPEAWTVTAGAGVIYDAGYSTQGPWKFVIPASVTESMPPRPATGQSRIDLVVARIYDSDLSVGAAKEIKVELVAGTAGTSPSAPATPALSLVLATLTVPASGTITITQSTGRVVAAGGILPVATTTERDALVTAGVAYRGLVVDNAQTGKLHRFDGATWKTLEEADDTGWVNVPLRSGFANLSGEPLQVRRRTGVVRLRGGISNAGIGASSTHIVGDLPAGFAPPITVGGAAGTGIGTQIASVIVTSSGQVQVRTSAAVSTFYYPDLTWLQD